MKNTLQNSALPPGIAQFAHELADHARSISLRHFRQPLIIDTKADESPVTVADREVEQALRAAIAQRYPHHGILGEEFGQEHTEAEFVWSIDPIDGTRSFISGHPLWGMLLGLLHCGVPVFGLIDMPATSERWVGRAGGEATLDGGPCRTRDTSELASAMLYATDPDIFDQTEAKQFASLRQAVYLRRFGGDCYSYGLLASGCIDLVMEAGLQPYDYLAVAPIVAAAGGVMTDWEGQALGLHSCGQVLAAANATLHREALACIQRA